MLRLPLVWCEPSPHSGDTRYQGMIHTKETPKEGLPAEGIQACANCGTALTGPWCHACGQAAHDPLASVRTFAAHVTSDLFSVDSRAVRSVRDLLLRPGVATRAYLDGRRVRYTGPLQIYLLAAALFFLVNAWRPIVAFDVRTRNISARLSAMGVRGHMTDDEAARLAARGIPIDTFRERFDDIVQGNLPTFMAGSILLFALALLAFYRRRGYMPHVVFALHWCAFYLLLMIGDRLLPAAGRLHDAVSIAILLVAWAYLIRALRVVYGESWPVTVAKSVGLMLCFQLVLSAWVLSVISLGMVSVRGSA
jgi:hypothetical protein